MSIFYQNLISPLEIKVEWERKSSLPPLTISISALMLNKDNVINRLEDFIFYGTPINDNVITSLDGSITCDALNFEKDFGTEGSYQMNIDLDKVPKTIDRINIVVSINVKGEEAQLPAFDSLSKSTFSIKDSTGLTFTTELNNTGESLCRCITVGLVCRYAQFWRFEEEMELKLGGLELVYDEYMKDSIIYSNPFSIIGDLCKIESKNKETKTDRTKNILKNTVKIFTSKFIHPTGKDNSKTSRNGHTPTGSNEPDTAGHETKKITNRGVMPSTKRTSHSPKVISQTPVKTTKKKKKKDINDNSFQSIHTRRNGRRGLMPTTKKKNVVDKPILTDKMPDSKEDIHDLKEMDNNSSKNVANMANRFANKKKK